MKTCNLEIGNIVKITNWRRRYFDFNDWVNRNYPDKLKNYNSSRYFCSHEGKMYKIVGIAEHGGIKGNLLIYLLENTQNSSEVLLVNENAIEIIA